MIQEAQSAGVPIIASDISCHASLLGSDYVGLHISESSEDVMKKLCSFFFDAVFRKRMETQISQCSAAKTGSMIEQEELSRVLTYIQT